MNYNYIVDISSWFFIVFMLGTILSSVTESILDFMNWDKGKLSKRIKELYEIHPIFRKFLPRSKITKGIEYHRDSQILSDFEDSATSGITTFMILIGFAPFVLHMCMTHVSDGTAGYIAFSLAMAVLKLLVSAPFSYYRTFVIEEKYKFNKSDIGTFVKDNVKGLVVSAVFSSIGILVLNYFMSTHRFTPCDILLLTGGCIVAGLVLEMFWMTFGIRIFNKLSPLGNKRLLGKIDRLLSGYGYKSSSVYVIDDSKRSSHANACIGGLWKTKKIILSDNLLKNYTDDEIVSILGHELAHGKLGHLWFNRMYSAAKSLAVYFAIFTFVYDVGMYHAFGFSWITEENVVKYSLIGIPLSSMVVGAITWILSPFEAWISRTMEYAADRYSVKYTGKKDPLASSLVKLNADNLSDVFPNRFYEAWNYGHPSLMRRISAIMDCEDVHEDRKAK